MQVQVLKAKIQETKGLPADTLKIVFKGKTVANEDTIEKLAIKETDFIVVMAQVAVTFTLSRNPPPRPKRRPSPKPQNRKRRKRQPRKRRRKHQNHRHLRKPPNNSQLKQK